MVQVVSTCLRLGVFIDHRSSFFLREFTVTVNITFTLMLKHTQTQHCYSPLLTEMPFNIDHLLNTNSTPSQEQRNNLQNFVLQLDEAILNTDGDISSTNEQIIAMQAKVLILQTRRTQLVQQRRCYSSLLSPVRCLPIEIFGEIFFYATRDHPRHVLILSAVCRLWRDAALSTPILWSTLELGRHTTKHNMDNHVDSWIERAHSYPLSLVIKKQDDIWSRLDPVCNGLTLITVHQWKSITLDSDDTSILSILKELKFSNLEMLESFSLATRFRSNSDLTIPDALQYAPKLKTLSLYIMDCVAFDTLPFPWRQLTSLTITFWAWDNNHIGVDILQACVNLEECTIDGLGDGSGTNDSITLNYLLKLHTHCSSNKFLLCIKTPSIQDLAIDLRGREHSYPKIFYDYIKMIGSTLLKLSIAPSHINLVESIPYLRSLVELNLSDKTQYTHDDNRSIMMYGILSSLVVKPEMDPSTVPLPRLEVLKIICRATKNNQGIFMKVIESRWWSDEEECARQKRGQRSLSRIRHTVFMNANTELDMFYRDDVDVLRAQGMSIDFEYLTLG